MVPYAKIRLGLDERALGLTLLALGGGSIVAMPLAGVAIHYRGSRPVVAASSLAACLALPLLALAPTATLLGCALFAFGAALGAMDVAMNAQAIAVQQASARPIMSGLHAMYSVGGLAGAALISVLLGAGLTLHVAAVAIALVLLVLALSQQARFIPDGGAPHGATFTIVPSPRVLMLGALCFISFLAEGAVLDWSAVFLRDVRHVDVPIAGIGYAAFSATMVAGRLSGDRVTHRLGTARVLRLGGAIAALGFLAVAVVPWVAGTLAGFMIFGLGVSNVVPVLFSAAGRVPGVPPGIGLATVTTIAYSGLLLGPAMIGLIADVTSLSTAFVVVAGLLAVIAISSGAEPSQP
jgi:predicted MFS family arabinose efflux permease